MSRSSRRPLLLVGLAAAVATALSVLVIVMSGPDEGGDAAAQGAAGGRPNVVIVQTDDQRLDSLRVMRNVKHLLRRHGTEFQNHFATFPLCCPSRSTLLTGQYSHNHGVLSNVAPSGGYQALDHSSTLPVWLSEAGYHTGHVGKYMNGYVGDVADTVPPGWDEWYTAVAGGPMYDYGLYEKGPESPEGRRVKYGTDPEDYQTDVYADKAVDFIRRRAGASEPFFLQVDTLAPHQEGIGWEVRRNPRPAPRHVGRFGDAPPPRRPSFNERDVSDKPASLRQVERFDRGLRARIELRHRSRLESLLAVDDMVGRIVHALRGTGELANTVIVFTSDNGYMLGEHRLAHGKTRLYEESVHVPLIVRGPRFPPGATRGQLTANVDVAPTILAIAGAQARGRTLDGISLLPLATRRERPIRRDVLLENGIVGSVGVRTPRFAYFEHRGGGSELYDLRRDPFQLQSLHRAVRYRNVRRRLAEYLDWLRECSGETCQVGQPRLGLSLGYARDRTRAGARCVASSVTVRVRGPERSALLGVVFSLEGTRVGVVDAPPFEQEIPRERLRGARGSNLRALARLDGRRLTMVKRLPPRCGQARR